MKLSNLRAEIAAAKAAYQHGVIVRGFDGPDGCTLEEAAELLYQALVNADAYIAAHGQIAELPLYETARPYRLRLRGDDL